VGELLVAWGLVVAIGSGEVTVMAGHHKRLGQANCRFHSNAILAERTGFWDDHLATLFDATAVRIFTQSHCRPAVRFSRIMGAIASLKFHPQKIILFPEVIPL
jgi:hypothetical protein